MATLVAESVQQAATAQTGAESVDMVAMGKKTLVVPRVKPWLEQLIRAQTFAGLGLVTMIRPEALSPEVLAGALHELLNGPPPARHEIDFGGEEHAAAAIARWLPRDASTAAAWIR